jgi:hypothetical protein
VKVIEAPPEELKGRLNQPPITHAEAVAQIRRLKKNRVLSQGVAPIYEWLERMKKQETTSRFDDLMRQVVRVKPLKKKIPAKRKK